MTASFKGGSLAPIRRVRGNCESTRLDYRGALSAAHFAARFTTSKKTFNRSEIRGSACGLDESRIPLRFIRPTLAALVDNTAILRGAIDAGKEQRREEKALEAELTAEEYISRAQADDERDEEFRDWDAASEEFPKAAKLWRDIGEDCERNADRLANEATEEERKGNDQIDAAGDLSETPAAQEAHRKSAKQHFAEGKAKHEKAADLYVRAAGQYRQAARDWERAAEADKNAASKAPDSERTVKEADEAKDEFAKAATEFSSVAKMYNKAAEQRIAAADKSTAEKLSKQAQRAQASEASLKEKAKSSP